MTRDYECPKCGEWILVELDSENGDLTCPSCLERLRLDVDVDNYGMSNQRDLSKLVTFRSHWDEYPKDEQRICGDRDP